EDGIDRILLDASLSSDGNGGQKMGGQWTAVTPGISIQDSQKANAYFMIPAGTGTDATIRLTVTDGKSSNTMEQIIAVPALTTVRSFGLGKNLTEEVDNSVSYEWYFDQDNTG